MTEGESFGKYLLEKRLSVGGTAEVYLARPRVGQTPAPQVVIKRPLASLITDATTISSFVQEAQLQKSIRHPNVVQVYESGVVAGEPYMALEYVDGVDAYKLMSRVQQNSLVLPIQLAVYIARCVCDALDVVHSATDESGQPLGILHRDVSPANIYVSSLGEVKLGDFGVARPNARSPRPTRSSMLKGKYNYLSPEQVSGEPFNFQADIFSLGIVLAELLMGQPLFEGTSQLSVLLSIRDCKIDAFQQRAAEFPPALYAAVCKALKRNPEERFASAAEFSAALRPFEQGELSANEVIKTWVLWAREGSVEDTSSNASQDPPPVDEDPAPTQRAPNLAAAHAKHGEQLEQAAVQISKAAAASVPNKQQASWQDDPRRKPTVEVSRRPQSRPSYPPPTPPIAARITPLPPTPRPLAATERAAFAGINQLPPTSVRNPDTTQSEDYAYHEESSDDRSTLELSVPPSFIRYQDGKTKGPLTFANLVELIVTGEVDPDDEVDFMGDGFQPVRTIEMLARHLPVAPPTQNPRGSRPPDYYNDLARSTLLDALAPLHRKRETGLLVLEPGANEKTARREIYVREGVIVHVASTEQSELLGQMLVRRNIVSSSELDMALAVLPRFNGRLGDTLVALGLIDPVQLFQAIEDQGRDRIAAAFVWTTGTASFFRGNEPERVEFPLSLDIAAIMLSGLEVTLPGDQPIYRYRDRADRILRRVTLHGVLGFTLPKPVGLLVEAVGATGLSLRQALMRVAATHKLPAAAALRAVEVGMALGVLQIT